MIRYTKFKMTHYDDNGCRNIYDVVGEYKYVPNINPTLPEELWGDVEDKVVVLDTTVRDSNDEEVLYFGNIDDIVISNLVVRSVMAEEVLGEGNS